MLYGKDIDQNMKTTLFSLLVSNTVHVLLIHLRITLYPL